MLPKPFFRSSLHPLLQRAGIFVLACLVSSSLWATEARIEIGSFPKDGIEALQNASLTLAATQNPASTAQDLVAAARADYARMVGALYTLGHYGGVVSILIDGREAASLSPVDAPSEVREIILRVDPGPLFTFGSANIGPIAPGTTLPEGFTPGMPALSGTIRDSSDAAISGWRDVGHAKVAIADQSVTADHRTSSLFADIRLRPGPRLTFGSLNVTKPGKVRPDRVRDVAGLPSGEVFSPQALDEAAKRLRRSGAFQSVVLTEADMIGPGNTLDIDATLIDSKPRRVGFGAELSSLEGLTISGFWLHRNLFGGAERLRIEAESGGIGGDSGGIDYRLSARFERPATFTPDTTLYVEASVEKKNDPDYRERNAYSGVGLSHIFSDKLSGHLGVAYQYSEIDDAFGSRSLQHLLLPGRLTYDTRDNDLSARKGLYLDLQATPFVGLDPSSGGGRLLLDGRTYHSFRRDEGPVLAARAQLGSVFGAGLAEVPSAMLFYSGGAGTVRGQPFQSLAVTLPNGRRVGGRSFFALSAELRNPLSGPWSVVGFADTGFVCKDSWGTGNGQWHSGAGFGVRYDTGIGPIRVDVATPLDDDAGEDFELYIGIGQAF